jgi:hypothetical protein
MGREATERRDAEARGSGKGDGASGNKVRGVLVDCLVCTPREDGTAQRRKVRPRDKRTGARVTVQCALRDDCFALGGSAATTSGGQRDGSVLAGSAVRRPGSLDARNQQRRGGDEGDVARRHGVGVFVTRQPRWGGLCLSQATTTGCGRSRG